MKFFNLKKLLDQKTVIKKLDQKMPSSIWPSEYYENNPDDIYNDILFHIIQVDPGITRAAMAQQFIIRIEGFNSGGWGNYALTDEQKSNLRDVRYPFELAWRAIDSYTVGAYGI